MGKIVGSVTVKPTKDNVNRTSKTQLKESNEKMFVMYAKPIQDELDRQVNIIQDHGGALPE